MSHVPATITQTPPAHPGTKKSGGGRRPVLIESSTSSQHLRQQFEKDYLRCMSSNDLGGMIAACICIIDSCLKERCDLTMCVEWTEELLRLHSQAAGDLLQRDEVELVCCMVRSLTYHNHEHPDLLRWVGRARQFMQTVPEEALQVELAAVVVPCYFWIGESFELRRVVEDLLPSPDSLQDVPAALIRLLGVKAMAELYFGALDEAITHVELAWSLVNDYAVDSCATQVLLLGVCAALLAGRDDLARTYIAGMQNHKNRAGELWVARFHAVTAWKAHASGCHAESRALLQLMFGEPDSMKCPLTRLIAYLLAAQLHFEAGEADRACELLNEARQSGLGVQSRLCTYLCGLVEAYFLLCLDSSHQAGLERLHAALSLGRTDDITCHPGVRREVLTFVCIKALENGIESKQARKIITTLKLMPAEPPIELEQWPWPLKIYTLGRFNLVREGVPLCFAGKIQKKPMEMLKALIAFGGRNVSEEKLCDQLWSTAAGDDAHKSFVVTLHRLRRLLGDERFLLNKDGLLSLNQRYCWVDVWAFNRHAGQALALFNGDSGDPSSAAGQAHKAIAQYTGHFLAGDAERQWSLPMRERLRSKLLSIIRASGLFWERAGDWRRAAECYQKGIETDDLVEEHYQRLMACHWQMGDRGAVMSIYRRCCSALGMYGVKPSPKTTEVYEASVYGPMIEPAPRSPR